MRTRRQFQPVVDGLPCRIAPSGMLVAPHALLMASHTVFATPAPFPSHPAPLSHAVSAAPSGPTMSPDDTDMPETGTAGPVMAGDPPLNGTGTNVS
jgi:hypothetical protein